MIISDSHHLAFVHNPKCAGGTIKKSLRAIEAYPGRFQGSFDYPDGGSQLLVHLPLADVRTYFPDIFEKIGRYESYAVVREPRSRFASALFEYLKGTLAINPSTCSTLGFRKEALEIIPSLKNPENMRAPWLAVFLPQSAFVRVDKQQIVRNLYLFDDLPRLAADMQVRHGVRLDLTIHRHQAYLPDNPVVQRLKDAARPVLSRLIAPDLRAQARAELRAVTGNSPRRLYRQLFADPAIATFVDDYYAEDIELYQTLVRARKLRTGA